LNPAVICFIAPAELSSEVKDTNIGNDVWIGYDATILPGVNFGRGCVVGCDIETLRNASR